MNLLIRADASTHIGTGHVMRCLALAQAWQEAGGRVTLASAPLPRTLGERLVSEGVALEMLTAAPGSLEDARQTAQLARAADVGWVVVDGYQFGADYQQALKDAGLNLLFVDDYGHAGEYCADLVLNQNLYAHESLYARRAPHTRLLLGPRYVLLRREFWRWRGWQRETPDLARKVLVTMGGSDSDNVTLRVIHALEQIDLPNLEIVVVVGGGNPHYEQLQAAVERAKHTIRLERNVSDMPALMAWADLAVTAGGSTCYELAFMGLPFLTTVLADNQRLGAWGLKEAGVTDIIEFGRNRDDTDSIAPLALALENSDLRKEWSRKSSSLISGDGAIRLNDLLVAERS